MKAEAKQTVVITVELNEHDTEKLKELAPYGNPASLPNNWDNDAKWFLRRLRQAVDDAEDTLR